MSVQPQPWPEPDPQVAAAIRAMYRGRREVPLAVQVRDRLGELFPDAAFADAFARVGKPGWSPGRLALGTVLQKAANLTDRQAADEVRENLAWKYALGLDLEDPGFDHSVLSEFRSRVVAHGLEERVLDLLLERLRALDMVRAGDSQRTDSTHVVAAVRDLNRLELIGESVRAALNALAAACPHWVDQVLVVADWSHRYADRIDNWRMPPPRPSSTNSPCTTPPTATPCCRPCTHPRPRHGCASCPRSRPCGSCCCRTTSASRTRAADCGSGAASAPRTKATACRPPRHAWHPPTTPTPAGPPSARRSGTATSSTSPRPAIRRPTGTRPARPNIITNVATTASTLPDTKALEPIHQSLQRRQLLPPGTTSTPATPAPT